MVSKFFGFMISLAIAAVVLPGIALFAAASAQPSNVSQIRDAEIENTIRAYAVPIFTAARLDADAVRVILVNDSSINAFVANGQRLFIFTGLLMKATSAGQVIGVIAHESGHIAGGHLIRLREKLDSATIEYIIEQILTVAAAGVASSKGGMGAGNNSGPNAGITERDVLKYSRTQESAADQAATVYLDRARISTRGLLTFSEMLLQQERVRGFRPDQYLLTHPPTQDRVSFLQHHVDTSPYSNTPVSPQLEAMHQRMVAKLYGFIDPGQAFRKYPQSDTSLPARYARAIAYYRSGNAMQGLGILDGLIRENPNDPYFHELRGQILFENQRIAESIPPYEKAVALLPSSNLIKIGLAQSLIEVNDATRTAQALKLLNSVSEEERTTSYWRLVAVAYDRQGNVGMRQLAQAELGYVRGARGEAVQNARRAMQLLPKGSPAWQRAQDIEFLAQKKKTNDPLGRGNVTAPTLAPAFQMAQHWANRCGQSFSGVVMSRLRSLPVLALGAALLALPLAASAQQNTTPQSPPPAAMPNLPAGIDRATIEQIVREYLMQHPEVIVEAITEMRRRQEQATAEMAQKAITEQREQLLNDPMAPIGGNAKGDVTIVEFFDYHCGYCKQVQPSMESLLKEDGKLRVVFKELPILAPESRIAAAGALAAQRQGRYVAMHNALMSARGKLDKSRVLEIGKSVGLDVAKLEKDMALPEIDAAIERNLKLAAQLGINGTPSFVIGDQLVPGAIDKDEIKKLIDQARKG